MTARATHCRCRRIALATLHCAERRPSAFDIYAACTATCRTHLLHLPPHQPPSHATNAAAAHQPIRQPSPIDMPPTRHRRTPPTPATSTFARHRRRPTRRTIITPSSHPRAHRADIVIRSPFIVIAHLRAHCAHRHCGMRAHCIHCIARRIACMHCDASDAANCIALLYCHCHSALHAATHCHSNAHTI